MSDTVPVRVAGPQFRYDYEWYEHGDELAVPPDVLEQYPRRLERVADAGDDDFDAAAFVDRTPMSEVVADIGSGDYDAHLDGIEAAEADDRDRKGVADAIAARREG